MFCVVTSIAVALVVASLVGRQQYLRPPRISWPWVARRAGLRTSTGGEQEWPRLSLGSDRGLSVTYLESSGRGMEERLEVHGLPDNISLGAHFPFEGALQARFLTGDTGFDRIFHTRAPSLEARAFLSSGVRARWRKLHEAHGFVQLLTGTLTVNASDLNQDEAVACIQTLLELGEALLEAYAQPLERITRELLAEPDASARLLMAQALDTPASLHALEVLVVSSELPLTLRAEALRTVATRAEPGVAVKEELLRWLQSGDGALQHAALEALLLRPDDASIAALERLTRDGDGTRGALAVQALTRVAGSDAEPRLVEALTHPTPQVRRAAVIALGEVGTRRAVDALAALAPSWLDGDLKQLAVDARRRIEERRGGADASRT